MKDVRQKILDSDEFVLDEVKKIQYLYNLKQEIRYNSSRTENIISESVAEHIYGVMILVYYFMPLEDTEHIYDKEKILTMMLFHDMDEIETGDKIGYLKSKKDREQENKAMEAVLNNMPTIISEGVKGSILEYVSQKTSESRFVRAIDKVEPLFELFNKNGKAVLQRNRTTYDQHMCIKQPYVKDFPILKRFNEVISLEMVKSKFFYSGKNDELISESKKTN